MQQYKIYIYLEAVCMYDWTYGQEESNIFCNTEVLIFFLNSPVLVFSEISGIVSDVKDPEDAPQVSAIS